MTSLLIWGRRGKSFLNEKDVTLLHILDDHNPRSSDRYWATDVKVLGSSDETVFGEQCWS